MKLLMQVYHHYEITVALKWTCELHFDVERENLQLHKLLKILVFILGLLFVWFTKQLYLSVKRGIKATRASCLYCEITCWICCFFLWQPVIPKVTKHLLSNPVFTCIILAACMEIAVVAGFAAFLGKYLEQQFNLTTTSANQLLGLSSQESRTSIQSCKVV